MEQIPYGELQIVPLTKRHELISFYSTNTDLNDFLKSDAMRDQENMTSKSYLCYWEKIIAGYITLVADTLEVESVSTVIKLMVIFIVNIQPLKSPDLQWTRS